MHSVALGSKRNQGSQYILVQTDSQGLITFEDLAKNSQINY